MGFSNLIANKVLASTNNYTQGRNGYKVCKITPHHAAGVISAEQLAKIFQNPSRQASANYCIGNDGTIVGGVDENNRAWTSASRSNDFQSITIEISNSQTGGNWPISDAAWNSLVNLCVDICKRHDFRLEYDGTKNGSLTTHDMFANTNCPGPYLKGRMQELADTVNARLDGNSEEYSENNSESKKNTETNIYHDGLVNCIYDIQEWLNRHYNTGLALDNIYGPKTKNALIKGLQTELNKQYNKGLAVDGIWGLKTYNACINVRQGAEGNITMLIQMALFIKGYSLSMDKKFGSDTTAKVKEFQKSKGLAADGIVGKNTFKALFA